MVQTRKQADAEAQAAVPTLPASIINPASSTPASAPSKGGGVKKPSPKKATPKKATPGKPSPDSPSPKDTVKDPSTTSSKEGSNKNDTSRDGQVARKTKTPAPKKEPATKTSKGVIEASLKEDEIADNNGAEPAKKKGKTKSKATRTKRAIKSDTADKDDTLGTRERPKKGTTAKKAQKPPPRNVPTNSGADPDETATEDDLDQKMKAYEKRKHKQAATKRKAPSIEAAEGQQFAEPLEKKTKRLATKHAAAEEDGAAPATKRKAASIEAAEGQLSAEPLNKKTKRLAARNADTEEDGLNGEPPQDIPSGRSFKRAAAATKRKAPSVDAVEGQHSAEPPKKKTKRSAARHAAADEDGPHDEPLDGMPSGGRSKRVAAATKKVAKAPKPQAKREVGTRRSARISDNLVVSSYEADYNMERRPVKTRFQKRAKTPEIPKNNIGLDENEIFSPRFPTEKPKPAKVIKRTRNGDRVSTNAEQRTLTREANRATLTAWERTTITRLTDRLIVPEARRDAGPILVGKPLPVRFERRSLDSSGYGIVELGTRVSLSQMPTLTSEIHSIWASRNFTFSKGPSEKHRAYNERAYRAISPALRLASRWIEEPEFDEFWHTLCLGALSHNKKTGAMKIHGRGPGGVYGETPFHKLNIATSEESTKGKTASLMQELAELESLEWRFEPTRVKYVGLSATEGQVSTLHDWFERDILYDSKPRPNSTRTTSERLRVLFFFAVHMCRELVQQVYHHIWARDFEDTPPARISEVLFETADGTSDYLGVAWDTFMFTGFIVKMNPHKFTQVDCPDGLSTALGRRAAEWEGSASPKTFAAIPMRWLNDLFQDTFWSQKESSSYFPRLPNGDPPYCAAGPFT